MYRASIESRGKNVICSLLSIVKEIAQIWHVSKEIFVHDLLILDLSLTSDDDRLLICE